MKLAPPNYGIFNALIREGYIPALWKCATVIPIPKVIPGRKIEDDLRPISLTDVLSKQIIPTIPSLLKVFVLQKHSHRKY